MSPTTAWSAARRGLSAAAVALAALAALAAAPFALADGVHAIEPGTDVVQGTTLPGDAPRLLPVRLFQGARFSLEVKADKGSLFRPSVVLRGADRKVDSAAVFVLDRRGVKATLRNYLPKATGLHWIEVMGADGSSGAWTLKSKVRLPKGVTGSGTLEPGGEPAEFAFMAPGRAVATIVVAGSPRESGAPGFEALRETGGPFTDPGTLKPGRAGFTLKGAQLPKQASYSLLVAPAAGGPGTFTVKVAWKVTPPARRTLDASGVIADPVLLGISPSAGNQAEVVPVVLAVDFARPGATVEFRCGAVVITVPAGSITHQPGQALFSVNLAAFPHGTYDVAFLNADGGSSLLGKAFAVSAVSPVPISVFPTFAYEGAVRRLRISGTLFHGNAAPALRRGPASIPGTVVGSGAGFLDAEFDLAGAALGAWDVEVANPGAPPAVLAGAFRVLEVITLVSMTPPDNRAGLVVDAVILGRGFVDGAEANLVREGPGGPETIPGTSVVAVSSMEIRAVFDTTDAAPALWDLVLSFPTGEVRTLAGAFRTRAAGGGSDPVQPFSASQRADGPPALACNEATGEFLAAWVEEDPSGFALAWYVYAQILDAEGNAVGKPVKVSDDGGLMVKRYVTAGYDPARDEYLVVWTEKAAVTPTQVKGQIHPNGSASVLLYQVKAQRLAPADLARTGSNVRISDHTTYSRASAGTWYLGDFHAYRPALAFDPSAKGWEIAWMVEFDTSGLYFGDDYDVVVRSYDPGGGTLGTPLMAAVTDAHEGDPALAWDGKNGAMLLAYNARPSPKGGDLDLFLGTGGSFNLLVAGNGDDLGDPRLAVDPDAGMAVLAWTRAPLDGTRAAEAAAVSLGDLTAVAGKVQVLSSGGLDLLACPVVNRDAGAVHLFWTRQDGKGTTSVLRRTADVSSGSDLVLTGDEEDVSTGSGDEGLASAVFATPTGETAVLWLASIKASGNRTYRGDVLPQGILRGIDFWFRRLR